jgi:hypothetical protein
MKLWAFVLAASAALGGAEEAQFKALWDGQTLRGWHASGKGQWKIEQGSIHATHPRSEKEYGHLITDRSFTNFVARLKFKSVKGNSGFYFRLEEKGWGGVSGFQAEIDPQKDIGGLYETNGRGWLVQPKAADVKEWFKPGDWNEMRIEAMGSRLTVYVNGHKAAQLAEDKRGRPEGKLALQLHGNQEVDVWFKEIEISER